MKPERFCKNITDNVSASKKIVCEHKADLNYPAVAAASIVAKVKRDSIIEDYKKEYGHIGSGYPSDPTTITFLREFYEKNQKFPSFVRESWETIRKIKTEKNQQKLDNFL